MLARPLRPVDLVALAAFVRSSDFTEMTARQWPRTAPESPLRPSVLLPATALLGRARGQQVWTCWHEGKIRGMISGRPRSPGLVLDVERLFSLGVDGIIAGELLAAMAHLGAQHRYRRVFVDAHPSSEFSLAARRADFEHYTRATSFRLAAGVKVDRADVFAARPRAPADDMALFQLYGAAVPAPVRAAEAMTMQEWLGLLGPSWFVGITRRRQFVWENGANLTGWCQITAGQKSQYLDVLIHPKHEHETERFLRTALQQVKAKLPVYLVAREQQAYLEDAAQRCGFVAYAEMDRFVRMLAQRVPQPGLVQTKMVSV